MHPSNLMREAGSTRGFVTLDPERQGVTVVQRRKGQPAGTARAAFEAALSQMHDQRFAQRDPIKPDRRG